MKLFRGLINLALRLILLGLAGLVALSVIDPEGVSKKSPFYYEAGPVTTIVSELVPSKIKEETIPEFLHKISAWPAWATIEDKNNLAMTIDAAKDFDFDNFKAALTVMVMGISSRGEDAKELRWVALYEAVGKFLTPDLVVVFFIFSLAGAITFALIFRVMDNIWFNPFKMFEGTIRSLFGIVGATAFMIVKIALFFTWLLAVSVVIRPYDGIVYGYTELFCWLAGALFVIWSISVVVKADISIPGTREERGRAFGQDSGSAPVYPPQQVTPQPLPPQPPPQQAPHPQPQQPGHLQPPPTQGAKDGFHWTEP